MQAVIRSDPLIMHEYMEEYYKYKAFLFMGHACWKESIEDRVKKIKFWNQTF